jgi:hypothetical protein
MEKEQLNKWVYRLQDYIDKVESTQGEEQQSAIVALLGYLSSLKILID